MKNHAMLRLDSGVVEGNSAGNDDFLRKATRAV